VPIIGISAHVQPDDVRACEAAGMNLILSKPLSPEDLAASLNRLCRVSDVPASLAETLADLGAAQTRRLAALMLDRLRPEAEALAMALRDGDAEAVSRLAHQLKGAIGNFDMPDLVARLSRLGQGDPVPAAGIAAFLAAVDRAERDLSETLEALADPDQRFMPAAQ
jgi:two-component system sensor histidine kinase TorS